MLEDKRDFEDEDWQIEENLLRKFSGGSFFDVVRDIMEPAKDMEELDNSPLDFYLFGTCGFIKKLNN